MLRQRPAIGGTRLGRAFGRPILGILFGMDRGNGRFQIFQSQFELVRVAPFRPTPKSRMLEGGDQLFQAFDPFILTQVARLRGEQHRLQRSNFFK